MTRDPEKLLDLLGAPELRAGVRERVLSAARSAAFTRAVEQSAVDRVWESRSLRWTWLLAAAALTLAHLALPMDRTVPRPPTPSTLAREIPSPGSEKALRILDALLDPSLGGSV